MYYIKLYGMGKMIFADTYENYETPSEESNMKHIKGFIVDQRCGVYGNFQVSDVKEVTFDISPDGTTATVLITDADYNHIPSVGDWVFVRLKDANVTNFSCQVAEVNVVDPTTRNIVLNNNESVFGDPSESVEAFFLTIPDTGTYSTVKITNIDTVANIADIQHINDDNP